MNSSKKQAANRANARASTGPKTARGKSHSSQNARRHGLAVAALADPVLANEVEALARELVGESSDEDLLALARDVAAAQAVLTRARRTRHQVLVDAFSNPAAECEINLRIEVTAVARLGRTAGPLTAMPDDSTDRGVPGAESSAKSVLILAEHAEELALFERYERRALSKRKFAIRALDYARQRRPCGGE
ncbi:hypothetical protein [Bradyrhizobium sp. WYCCWR 12699]|uniref:hypothetical protein n=1 Tax=Bradyrhizobium sp. WYCCWR 12699 TaxID=3064203 RepID=UPI0028A4A2F7|nr:hypothetical protein [Bradyrhizobium sp. WYCCWR 12699]MDT4743674.1 hypothetical protein [Bradyrhizobium sp. WYCCWR 12699]